MSILRTYPDLKGLILDMDGVLWRDTESIGDLPTLFRRISELHLKVVLATNNATKSVDEYLDKLAGFGVQLSPEQIVNSPQAVLFHLKKSHPDGGVIYVVGQPSLSRMMVENGFRVVDSPEPEVIAVVAGMDYGFNYHKLKNATILIRRGVPFIGTNPDKTFPTPEGLMPGAGSILAAIETASGQAPLIVGKPQPLLFNLAMARMGVQPYETLAIGDRLETDIAGGQAVGCLTAAVLSGVTTLSQAQAWRPIPDIIAADLATLVG